MDYRDSTGLAPERLRERLAADGYLRLRGALPAAAVEEARRAVVDTVEAAGWARWDARVDRLRCRPDMWDVITPEQYNAIFRRLWSDRRLYGLAHEPALVGLVGSLLETDDVFVHPFKVLRLMVPTPATEARWPTRHQDFPELQGSAQQLTIWIPLFPVGPRSGALPVYPGTHTGGVLPLDLSPHPSGWEVVLPPGHRPAVGGLAPGDVLIFTTFTVHGGSVNDSDYLRVSIDARFQPLSSPISAPNLEPTGLDFDWAEAFAHWAADDPLRMYWTRRQPPTVPFDRRWEAWREREALRRGRLGDPVAERALRIAAAEAADERTRRVAAELLAGLEPADEAR